MQVPHTVRALALISILVLTAGAAPPKPKITGLFSNLTYIEEAGDLVGYEVFIVYGGESDFAVVQVAAGWPDPPEVVETQPPAPTSTSR
jgi:hypothetical protein